MTKLTRLLLASACCMAPALAAHSQGSFPKCTDTGWVDKPDDVFAADCVDMAFQGDLTDRETLAWMFFTRINQLIADPTNGGMSGTDVVPVWMAWPTDPGTFDSTTPFVFHKVPRTTMKPSAEKTDILEALEAGKVATADPDTANEEINRNEISYNYLINNGLTTKTDIATFFETNDYIDMPVGSVELKASWLQVTAETPVPEGALTFQFDSGEYWWRGLHIMVKMKSLTDPSDILYTETPSWFWTTFEFNNNPGVTHVRDTLITQRAPLAMDPISDILSVGDMAGFDFEAYAPNGTQVRLTEDADGVTPVILGHTDMEDFAGSPDTQDPAGWTSFDASCHTCHATAAYNLATKEFFPFSVPVGALTPEDNAPDGNKIAQYLG